MEKIRQQINVAAFIQLLKYDVGDPAAKENNITNAATERSNCATVSCRKL
jgi:hypothetical protein